MFRKQIWEIEIPKIKIVEIKIEIIVNEKNIIDGIKKDGNSSQEYGK